MLGLGRKLYEGRSLHIGLNAVDPLAYGGWQGHLLGCENDSIAMEEIANNLGYSPVVRINTKEATRERVINEILEATSALKPSDVFFLTYSGHGGQVPDLSSDEVDAKDETWCLYDGELIDDELFALLQKFAERTRVIVVSDSCHAGTVIKDSYRIPPAKSMPRAIIQPAYEANKALYDGVIRTGKAKYHELVCSAVLMSACQENQYSMDGVKYGFFTSILLQVWQDGMFRGDYWNFIKKVQEKMPPSQTPDLLWVGTKNLAFEWTKPFCIR